MACPKLLISCFIDHCRGNQFFICLSPASAATSSYAEASVCVLWWSVCLPPSPPWTNRRGATALCRATRVSAALCLPLHVKGEPFVQVIVLPPLSSLPFFFSVCSLLNLFLFWSTFVSEASKAFSVSRWTTYFIFEIHQPDLCKGNIKYEGEIWRAEKPFK